MIQDRHVEPAGAAGYLRADPAEADDAERAAVDLAANHERRIVLQKVRPAGVAVARDESATGREHQREGHVRRRPVEDARRVPNRDAAGGCGRDVDVIDADAAIADDAHAWKSVEQGGIDGRMAVGVNTVEWFGPRSGHVRPRNQFDESFE